MKTCTKCGCRLYAADFRRDKTKGDGRRPSCSLCVAKQWQKWYSGNKPVLVARVAAWRKANPQKAKAARKRYRIKHRQYFYAKRREWARKYPERAAALKRRIYWRNPAKARAKRRAKWKKNKT